MRFDFLRSVSVVVLSVFSFSSVAPAAMAASYNTLRTAGAEESNTQPLLARALQSGNRGVLLGGLQRNPTSGLEETVGPVLMKADDVPARLVYDTTILQIQYPGGVLERSSAGEVVNTKAPDSLIAYGTIRRAMSGMVKDGYVEVRINKGIASLAPATDLSLPRVLPVEAVPMAVEADAGIKTLTYDIGKGPVTLSRDNGDFANRSLLNLAREIAKESSVLHLKVEGDKAALSASASGLEETNSSVGLRSLLIVNPVKTNIDLMVAAADKLRSDLKVRGVHSAVELEAYLRVGEQMPDAVVLDLKTIGIAALNGIPSNIPVGLVGDKADRVARYVAVLAGTDSINYLVKESATVRDEEALRIARTLVESKRLVAVSANYAEDNLFQLLTDLDQLKRKAAGLEEGVVVSRADALAQIMAAAKAGKITSLELKGEIVSGLGSTMELSPDTNERGVNVRLKSVKGNVESVRLTIQDGNSVAVVQSLSRLPTSFPATRGPVTPEGDPRRAGQEESTVAIRPDVAPAFWNLAGNKIVNGRQISVQGLISRLSRDFERDFEAVLGARGEYRQRVAANEVQYGFSDPAKVITDVDGNRSIVADIRQGMVDNFTGTDSPNAWRLNAEIPIPAEVTRPGLQGTGPGAKVGMLIGAVNAGRNGAKSWMIDGEDAAPIVKDEPYRQVSNLSDLSAGRLGGVQTDSSTGKTYEIEAVRSADQAQNQWPTIFYRVPGLHLRSRTITLDGKAVPEIIPMMVLYALNNYDSQTANGSGIYFYIPKIETPEEALLIAKLLKAVEDELGLPRGTIKIEMLHERARYTSNQESVMWVLRHWLVGPNVGRWDYINSRIEMVKDNPEGVFPDPNKVTMLDPTMTEYTRRNAILTLLVGGFPVGGMSAVMEKPKATAEVNAKAVRSIGFDKLRERLTGLIVMPNDTEYDAYRQSWVATTAKGYVEAGAIPLQAERGALQGLVDQATADEKAKLEKLGLIDAAGQITPFQVTTDYLDNLYSDDAWTRLFNRPAGTVTEEGLRYAIHMASEYMFQVLNGNAAAAIDDPLNGTRLMNDFATYEIFWHWLWSAQRHQVALSDASGNLTGAKVTPELIHRLLQEKGDAVQESFAKTPANPRGFDRSLAPVVIDLLERQLSYPEWITYGSRVLFSVLEKDAAQRAVILDGIFGSRDQALRNVGLARFQGNASALDLAQQALTAHDFVRDIFPDAAADEAVINQVTTAAWGQGRVVTGVDAVVGAIPESPLVHRVLIYRASDGTEQRAVIALGKWTPAQAVPGAFAAMELRPNTGRVTMTIAGTEITLVKVPDEEVVVPVTAAVKLPLTARLANMFGVFRFSVDATDNISNEFVDYVGSVGGDKGTLNPSSVGKSAETGQMNSLVREFVSSTVRGANLLWQLVKRHVSAVFLPRVETSVELDPTVPSVYALTLDGKNPVSVKQGDEIVVKQEFQAIIGKKTLKPGEQLTPAQARQVHSLMVQQWVAQALEIHRLGDNATVKIGHTKSLTPIMGDWGVRVGLDVMHILSVLGIHRNFTLGFTEEDANLALQANRVVQAELDAVKALDLQTVSADQVISTLNALYTPEIRGDFKESPLPLATLDKTSPVILPDQRVAKGYRPAGRAYFSLFASRVDAKVNSAEWKAQFTDDQQKYFGIVNLLYVMVTHYNDQVPWNKAHGQVVIPASLEPKVEGQLGDFYFNLLVGWGYQVVPTASKKVVDAFNARTVIDSTTGQARELSEAELFKIAMRTQIMKRAYADKLAAQGPLSPVIDQAAAIDVIAQRFVQEGFYADLATARGVVESIVKYRQNNPQGYDKMMNQLYPEGDDKFTGPHLLGVQSVNQKIEMVAANRQSAQLVAELQRIGYAPVRIADETGSEAPPANLADVAALLERNDSAVVALSLAENRLIVRTVIPKNTALAQAGLAYLLSLTGPLADLRAAAAQKRVVAAQQQAEEAKTALRNAFGTLPLDAPGTYVYSGPSALAQLSEVLADDAQVAVIGARYEEGNPASVLTTPRRTAIASVSAEPDKFLVIRIASDQLALVRKEGLATAEAAKAKATAPVPAEVTVPVVPTLLERIVAKVGAPITAKVVNPDEQQLGLPSRLWLHNGLLRPDFIAKEQITDLPADRAGVVAVWADKQAVIQSTDLVLLNANTVPSAEADQWLVGLPADRKPVVLRLSNNDIAVAQNQNILAALVQIAREQGGYLDVIGMTYDPATQVLSVQA